MASNSYPRLDSAAQTALLRRIVDRCRFVEGSPRPVVVFDLDGTLMDNRPRSLAIFHELAVHWKAARPAESEKLAAATVDRLQYLVAQSMNALGVEDPAAIKEAEQFWKERFFVDEYIRHDIEVPGAVAFAKACWEAGANLAYFTGRDLPNMALGSFQSLRDLGFPIGCPGTELVCKPYFEMPDEEYKTKEGPSLNRLGRVVAVFDNEPGNCNTLLKHYEGCDSVFIDTQHFPGAPALVPAVHIVGDFRLS